MFRIIMAVLANWTEQLHKKLQQHRPGFFLTNFERVYMNPCQLWLLFVSTLFFSQLSIKKKKLSQHEYSGLELIKRKCLKTIL